ncbi:MAG: hypothetical protein ACPIOQ_23040 [Promethearchaeia archaeon]
MLAQVLREEPSGGMYPAGGSGMPSRRVKKPISACQQRTIGQFQPKQLVQGRHARSRPARRHYACAATTAKEQQQCRRERKTAMGRWGGGQRGTRHAARPDVAVSSYRSER